MDESTYAPGGLTALLDAVGNAIISVEKRMKEMPEGSKPSKVIMVIITDGQENQSREFSSSQIKKMVEERQTSRFWEFMFLAANVDAFSEAGAIGVNTTNVSNYSQRGGGTKMAFASSSVRMTSMRSGKSAEDLGQLNVDDDAKDNADDK